MIIDPAKITTDQYTRLLTSGHARLHFSQLGEDAVLLHVLGEKRDGYYVDIGCHHPLRFSNTAILSEFYGWRGINVDADRSLMDAFDQARPNDVNLCLCIGGARGRREFTVFHEPAVSTADQEHAKHMAHTFSVKDRIMLDVYPLAEVLATHLPPDVEIDLLSVDVEGLDLEVLRSNDWERFRPRVVAVETHGLSLVDVASHPTQLFLRENGYELTSHLVVTSVYERVR